MTWSQWQGKHEDTWEHMDFSQVKLALLHCLSLPNKGTESDVGGIISVTSNMRTVKASRTVMPERKRDSEREEAQLPITTQVKL